MHRVCICYGTIPFVFLEEIKLEINYTAGVFLFNTKCSESINIDDNDIKSVRLTATWVRCKCREQNAAPLKIYYCTRLDN